MPLNIEKVEVNFFPPTIFVKNLLLSFEGVNVRFNEVKVELSPLQGIFGKILVRKVLFDEGEVEINMNKISSRFKQRFIFTSGKNIFYFNLKDVEFRKIRFTLSNLSLRPGESFNIEFLIQNLLASYNQKKGKIFLNSAYLDGITFSTNEFTMREYELVSGDGIFDTGDRKLEMKEIHLGRKGKNCDIYLKNIISHKGVIFLSAQFNSSLSSEGCLELEHLLPDDLALGGNMRCNIERAFLNHSFSDIKGQFDCGIFNLKINDFRLGNQYFRGEIQNRRVRFDEYKAEMMGGDISGNAWLDFASKRFNAETDLNGLTIEDIVLSSGLPHSVVTGRISSGFLKWASSDLRKFELSGDLKIEDFNTYDEDFRSPTKIKIIEVDSGRLKLKGFLSSNYFELRESIITLSGNDRIRAEGYFNYEDSLTISALTENLPLFKLKHIGPVDVGGYVDGECFVSSDYKGVRVNGRFKIADGKVFGFFYKVLAGKVEYDNEHLAFTNISGSLGDGFFRGDVDVDFSIPEGMVRAFIYSDKLNPLYLKNEYADLRFYINLFSPSEEIYAESVKLNAEGPFKDVAVEFSGVLNNLPLRNSPGLHELHFNGTFHKDNFSLRVEENSKRFHFLITSLIPESFHLPSEINIESEINEFPFEYRGIKGDLKGTVKLRNIYSWEGEGDFLLSLTDNSLLLPQSTFRVKGNLKNDKLNVTASGEGLAMKALYDLKRTEGELSFQSSKETPLFLFDSLPFYMKGDFILKGNLKAKRFEGMIENPLIFRIEEKEFTSGKNLVFAYNRGKISISAGNADSLILSSHNLNEGIVLGKEGKIHLNFQEDLFGLKRLIISKFNVNLSSEGELIFDPASMSFSGLVKIGTVNYADKIFLQMEDPVFHLSGGLDEIIFKNDSASQVRVFPFRRNFDFKIKGLNFLYRDSFSLKGICGIEWGKIVNVECEIPRQKILYDLSWYEFANPSKKEPADLTFSFSRPIHFSVNINELSLESQNHKLTLSGSLSFSKDKQSSNLSGYFKLGGNYRFRNIWFEISRGSVRLDNSKPWVPYLSVKAFSEITSLQGIEKKYTVYADVEGWADDIKIKLYSRPELNRGEIVSLITFGIPETKDTEFKRNASNIENTALGMEFLFGREMNEAARVMGLTHVKLVSSYEEDILKSSSKIIFTSSLSDRLSLQYEKSLLDDLQKVFLEYKISDKIGLTGTWDSNKDLLMEKSTSSVGNFGFKLKGTYEFDW